MTLTGSQIDSLEAALEKALELHSQLLKRYENLLYAERAAEARNFQLEEIGPASANGSITLTRKINQRSIIDIIVVNIDAGTAATLQLGRYTRTIKNAQQQETILAPVRYEVEPADIIKMSWVGVPTVMPYFALFGHYVGSQYG